MTVPPPAAVPVSPFLLLWLLVRINTLMELLAMARQTVDDQQAEFTDQRAECTRRSS
jgi:hypothetical protein